MEINIDSPLNTYTIRIQVTEDEAYAIKTFLGSLSKGSVERLIREYGSRTRNPDMGLPNLTQKAYKFTANLFSKLADIVR